MKNRILIKTLGALALGVFFSCASDDTVVPFAQDRNVAAIDIPEIDSLVLDSVNRGIYPDSLSGWELRWAKPISEGGAVALYVLGDSMPDERADKLANGSGDFDFSGAGLRAPLARLTAQDTVWRIPSALLGGQGKRIRTDTVFWFSVWLRYQDGAVGSPVRAYLFLGDNIPPQPGRVDTIVGQTTFAFDFDRPRDPTSRYDDSANGELSFIRSIWWRGRQLSDSSGGRAETTYVARDSVRDTSIHRFHLSLHGLEYDSPHLVILQMADDTGNVATLGPWPVNTRDATIPASAQNPRLSVDNHTRATFRWKAATDSFRSQTPQYSTSPNHGIRSYRVLLSEGGVAPWIAVDSLDLFANDTSNFHRGDSWPSIRTLSRFHWGRDEWEWSWPNIAPGDSFRLAMIARDRSGNPTRDTLFVAGRTSPIEGITCPPDKGLRPVKGTGQIGDFCIEQFEHRIDGKPATQVTWKQAAAACVEDGGFLCSEMQWEQACQGDPDDASARLQYGAREIGMDPDTLGWLLEACNMGGGPASVLRSSDLATHDLRCVSGWGVRDLPGHLSEWTLDTWTLRPDTIPPSRRDSWSGAYQGKSDQHDSISYGVLHGGSWVDQGNPNALLEQATCKGRTYAVRKGSLIPDSLGKSSAWGYRCCHRPL
ncbi:MAG: SUMF1/EgtB/PvdO family nonheme iron enzyme [Fibrobacteria bacterium]|nr:SUMF1/EgtB/PvdO family nonheme iron enzyme [Fibrobacteria bacterium]